MSNEKLILQVAQLIAEGKGDEVEKALNALNAKEEMNDKTKEVVEAIDNIHLKTENEENNESEDYEDDDFVEDEEDEEDKVEEYITGTLKMLDMMYVNGDILTIPVPTLYGTIILVSMKNREYATDVMQSAVDVIGLDAMPVTVSTMWDEGIETYVEVLRNYPKLYNGTSSMFILFPKQALNLKYGYILPVSSAYGGCGCVSTDLQDMEKALQAMLRYLENGETQFIQFPELGCKVLKSDGTCKGGVSYQEDVIYYADGELIPHKNGIHYASNPESLKTWYRNDYKENIPLVVQPGCNVIDAGHSAKVTDVMMVLRRITWGDVEELID